MKDTLIIIPAYNEESSIGDVIRDLLRSGANAYADILVVNDNSTDDTAQVVEDFGGRVLLISHIFNMGYGAALKTGYSYAEKNGYQYIIQLDGDGQHSIENVKMLHSRITRNGAADIVIGSRFLKESESYKVSFVKRIAIRFFGLIIKGVTKKTISDPTSGLQAMNKNAFSYYAGFMNFDPKYPDANMIIKMSLLGYKIEEIPAIMYPRYTGTSIHSGIKPIFYMFHMVLSTFIVMLQLRFLKIKGRKSID